MFQTPRASDHQTDALATFDHRIDSLASDLVASERLLETKIRRTLMCGCEEARSGLIETIKFMFLVAQHPTLTLTPAQRVDLVWHEFILFTRLYADFCQAQFGRFIHHTPGGTKKANLEQFATTLRLYQLRFGTAPSLFWGAMDQNMASCGNCESIRK